MRALRMGLGEAGCPTTLPPPSLLTGKVVLSATFSLQVGFFFSTKTGISSVYFSFTVVYPVL